MTLCWRARLLNFVVLWLAVSCVAGWDNDGHAAIGMTAMSGVNRDALTQLKRLLNGRDIVDVSGWGHKLATKYPGMEAVAFQIETRESEDRNCSELMRDSYVSQDCTHPGGCLLQAMEYLYATLTGQDISQGPLAKFKWPVKLKMTDSDHMKLLIHLIGDLHEPLRLGFSFNNAGRDTQINYMDTGKKTNTSLFDYWESTLIQKMIRERPNFWFSGWTHINSLGRSTIDQEHKTWDNAEDKSIAFHQWMQESREHMCKRLMQPWRPINAPPRPANESETWIQDGYDVHATTVFVDFEFAKSRLLIAGARASIVLNSILASRDAKKLRRGSSVLVQQEGEYRVMLPAAGGGAHQTSVKGGMAVGGSNNWMRNLMLNSSILAIVLIGFIAVTRWLPFAGGGNGARSSASHSGTGVGKKGDTKFS